MKRIKNVKLIGIRPGQAFILPHVMLRIDVREQAYWIAFFEKNLIQLWIPL